MELSTIVAPSVLAANFLELGKELQDVEAAGAGWHHIDVMDGNFVPNLSFGLPLISAFKKTAKIPLDVHIMISNPDQMALDYVHAGADWLTFHLEASQHPHRLCQAIRGAGAKAGVAINPGTPVESVFPLLDVVDLVLVMSVNPGFGGQKFIPSSLNKVEVLSQKIAESQSNAIISVDGGVDKNTAPSLIKAGARALVAGSAVYGKTDRKSAILDILG